MMGRHGVASLGRNAYVHNLPNSKEPEGHLELEPSVEPVHPPVAVNVQRRVELRHHPSLLVVASSTRQTK